MSERRRNIKVGEGVGVGEITNILSKREVFVSGTNREDKILSSLKQPQNLYLKIGHKSEKKILRKNNE